MTDSILNSPKFACLQASSEVCEKILRYFTDKVTNIRAHIVPPSFNRFIAVTCSVVFNQFEPVSFHLSPKLLANSNLHPVLQTPPCLFEEVWETIGPTVHKIINSSLASGSVPEFFEQAVVESLTKKT